MTTKAILFLFVLMFDIVNTEQRNKTPQHPSSIQNNPRSSFKRGDNKKQVLLNLTKPLIPTIVPNYEKIDSIKQLYSIFPNELVLIDLWATWCPACFEEFKYNKSLNSVIKEKKVSLLYISFDEDTLDNSWRKALLKENLMGSHIRANKKLKDDICVHIWKVKNAFSIPHLFMVYNGKIVKRDVGEPHDGNMFYTKIDSLTYQYSKHKNP